MMAERNTPYVYVEEKTGGPNPIQGVSASALGLVAGFERGPTNEPQLVTSLDQAQSLFGAFNDESLGMHAAYIFFANGGSRIYASRVVAPDAVKASTYLGYNVTDENTGEEGDGSEDTFSIEVQRTPIVEGTLVLRALGLQSTGTITVSGAPDDGGTFRIDDGVRAITFEFDPSGTVAPGNLWIKISGNSATQAQLIADAINMSPLTITAARAAGAAVVNLQNDAPGTAGNTTSAASVANVAVTNMAGGTNSRVVTDDGSGGLTGDGTGTVDYLTGEVEVVFSSAPALNSQILCDYTAKTFTFDMKWEGEAGNAYVISIVGNAAFEDEEEGMFERFDLVISRVDDGTPIETFTELSFTSSSDANYVVTVLNDAENGSDLVSVIAHGNDLSPQGLTGVNRPNVTLYSDTPYDGVAKEFTYDLDEPVWPGSFQAEFEFAVNAESVGALGSATYSGTVARPSVVPGSFVIRDAGGPGQTVYDDGDGNLVGDVGVGPSGSNTIDYSTGEYSVIFAGVTVAAPTASYLTLTRIVDDGVGSIVEEDSSGFFSLYAAGPNEIDYNTGEITLTWATAPIYGDGLNASAPTGLLRLTRQECEYHVAATDADGTESLSMQDGSNGSALTRSDFIGAQAQVDGTGIYAMNAVDEILTLCVPDFETDPIASLAIISYSQARGDRFPVLSVPLGMTPQQALNYRNRTLNANSSFGAIQYPHIRIINPVNDRAMLMPGGAHTAGRYAATDQTRNVSKAPAGTVDGALSYLIGLERTLNPTEVGLLDKAGINCFVDWPQTGRVLWGTNTLKRSGEFREVAERRMFMYLEKSVFNESFDFVFEDNGPSLWSQLQGRTYSFMLERFNEGYFAGKTPASAFFVKCDDTNNSLTSGSVYCDVGVATKKAGKFIVFRFQRILATT